jgi:hypothetical protein
MESVVLLMFFVHPILFGVYSQKWRHRTGAIWAVVSFFTNLIMLIIFIAVSRLPYSTTNLSIGSGISILFCTITMAILLAQSEDPPAPPPKDDFSVRLWRGVFRIWVLASASWVIAWTIIYYQSCGWFVQERALCYFSRRRDYLTSQSYFDVIIWFIGVPALGIVTALAACWVINGFRRLDKQNHGETVLLGTDPIGPPEPSKQD